LDLHTPLPRLRPLEAFPVHHNGETLIAIRDPYHFSDSILTISPAAAVIVQLLNGQSTLVGIQESLTRATGTMFPSDKILEVIHALDTSFFLENDRFEQHRQSVIRSFSAAAVRPAHLAGKSYPADPAELRSLLDGLFSQSARPADPQFRTSTVAGVIAPHIDFSRGGATYVPAYRSLADSSAETFVILGISHTGGETPLIVSRKDYQTPLGRAETDRDLADRLDRNLRGKPGWEDPYRSEISHAFEHSIEFQVVFLQYALRGRPMRILPILCAFSHEEVQTELQSGRPGPIGSFLQALADAVSESGRRVAYIAGVDFAHVGSQFGDTFPVGQKELAHLRERDVQMMALLSASGSESFHRFIHDESNARRVCGYPAIYSFLSLLPESARREGQVLKYDQWPDENGTVTFGSLVFTQPAA